jgi:hypothetical protein
MTAEESEVFRFFPGFEVKKACPYGLPKIKVMRTINAKEKNMKKKLLLITGLLVLATAVFAMEAESMMTYSGRLAAVGYRYEGKYKGQTVANTLQSVESTKPSKDHWELINRVLNKYDTEKGDTFGIIIAFTRGGVYSFICEYTSATEYKYWFFEAKPRL